MRAILLVLAITQAGCGAWRMHTETGDPVCGATWEIDRLEQRDALTETNDVTFVDPTPIWMGDLDGDGKRDVVLRYKGSRTHEAIVLRGCGGSRYQVVLDEVRATRVGTSPGAGGWLDLELVDGKHDALYKHGASGYEGPPQQLKQDFDWN